MKNFLKKVRVVAVLFFVLLSNIFAVGSSAKNVYAANNKFENLYGYQTLKKMESKTPLEIYLQLEEKIGSYKGGSEKEFFDFGELYPGKEEFDYAWYAFRGDFPEYFWYSPFYPKLNYNDSNMIVGAEVKYPVTSKAQLKKDKKTFNKATNDILKSCNLKKNMSEFKKELIIWLKLRESFTYTSGVGNEYSCYLAIVEQKGVCLNCANAYAWLLKKNNIMAYVVSGICPPDGGAHARVAVRIDGEYSWCDPTWYNAYSSSVEKYLNMTDNINRENNFVPDAAYQAPSCNTSIDKYFKKLGTVKKKNVNSVAKVFSNAKFVLGDYEYYPIYISGEFKDYDGFHSWWNQNYKALMEKTSEANGNLQSFARIGDNIWIIRRKI